MMGFALLENVWLKSKAVGDVSPTEKTLSTKQVQNLVPPEMYRLIIPFGDFKICSSSSNFVL